MNILERRYYTLIGIILLVSLIFLFKLFSIQVMDEKYAEAAKGNHRQQRIEYPFRGLVYDRNQELLVYNEPFFDLMVIPREVKIDTAEFCKLLQIDRIEFDEHIKRCRKYSRHKPSVFLKQLSQTEVASIEDKLIGFPGFYPQSRTVRRYGFNSLPHVLGYVSEIDQKELERHKGEGYLPGDFIGKYGLESYYESDLKGKRGMRYVMVNRMGVEKGKYDNGERDIPSEAGKNIETTIDIKLQQYAERLFLGKTGSVIAIEPSTGELLSFVSAPGYDPNLLTGRNFSKNYGQLQIDTNKVLFNRAISGDRYPPGSIFKTAQSLVALQEGLITPETRFRCNRGLVNCHGPHTNEDLRGAITFSCNPYFWNVFKRLVNRGKAQSRFLDTEIGLKLWKDSMRKFGFDTKLKLDLDNVKSGQIPGVKYYNNLYGEGRWKHSTIRSLDIGQGEIGISPLQMANFAAILANRGYYITPHLVRSVGGDKSFNPEFTKRHSVGIDKVHFGPVLDGMEQVVQKGTGFRARLDSVIVCGKTGTSQNPHGEDHSVFIAFAPRDNPKIAVAVYVENAGQGARAAASIAGLVIEKYLFNEISEYRKKYIEDYVMKNHFIY